MTRCLQCLKKIPSLILRLQVNIFPVFAESERSLPYSQQPENENYPEPHEENHSTIHCHLIDTTQTKIIME